jgi:hypothetical protein
MSSKRTQPELPALLFQFSTRGLELLNRRWNDYPGLTLNKWLGISRGGWRSLVPEEYHPHVQKLMELSHGYTVVEFPIYWNDSTFWLTVFAAAVDEAGGGRKIVGLVQDISAQQEHAGSEQLLPEQGISSGILADMYHDISSPLTSIIVNCELLLEDEATSASKEKLQSILSEAIQIDRQLRAYRRA